MTLSDQNQLAAANTIRRVQGPSILLGDGSYFDYENPADTQMTIEDYAWALAAQGRWSGQTRCRLQGNRRCIFTVCEHVVRLAEQLLRDGYPDDVAFAGLMHESDEIVFPDIASPAKSMLDTNARQIIKWWGECIGDRFNVPTHWGDVIKLYDIRMLATEKRDLMPQGAKDHWSILEGYEPFKFEIIPWPSAEHAVRRFLGLYEKLRP